MDLLVLPDGTVRAIYAEDIDLGLLGSPQSSQEPATSNRTNRVAGARTSRP